MWKKATNCLIWDKAFVSVYFMFIHLLVFLPRVNCHRFSRSSKRVCVIIWFLAICFWFPILFVLGFWTLLIMEFGCIFSPLLTVELCSCLFCLHLLEMVEMPLWVSGFCLYLGPIYLSMYSTTCPFINSCFKKCYFATKEMAWKGLQHRLCFVLQLTYLTEVKYKNLRCCNHVYISCNFIFVHHYTSEENNSFLLK